MTNELLHRFGGGALARLRSPGVVGRVWILSVALGLLVCAVPALAAEIVEVRVGKHPTFTRVVFELDRAAGYRIERSDPSMDVAELIVSLEASSIPRSISKKKALIEQVDVEPNGRRSTARVRLSQDGLRLKEMILTNPPRIVLDLLDDGPAPAVAPNMAKAEAAPAPTATDEDQAFDDIVAGIEPDATPQASEPTPAPVEVATAKVEEAGRGASGIEEPEPASIEVASADVMTEAATAAEDTFEDAADAALFDDDPQMAATGEAATDEAGDPTEFDVDRALAELNQAPTAAPAPKKAEAPKKPRPMVAKSTPEEDGGWMTWALAGGAVLLLAGGAFFFLKRRGGASDDDWDDEEDDDAIGFGNEDASEANPFAASDDEQTILGGADEQTSAAGLMDGDETMMVAVPDEEKESESVVFDSEENDMDDMEVISREQVNESLGAPAMPPVAGGVSEDVQAMFAEMTRRMEALEARCDELVDARDRLERQVAAQTEELRVQRAAIARTQRAVRNLGRGEEDVSEQEPTEPALREPTPE